MLDKPALEVLSILVLDRSVVDANDGSSDAWFVVCTVGTVTVLSTVVVIWDRDAVLCVSMVGVIELAPHEAQHSVATSKLLQSVPSIAFCAT